LPKIKNEELYDTYPELANRFFDTMNIQKGTSKLLIDFSAAFVANYFRSYFCFLTILTYCFGFLLFLLLFLFLSFHINLLETSLKESKFKYKVVLVARNGRNTQFQNDLNYNYGLQKTTIL
jgi:predicted membrane metal-binding protein